ncbi:hypothetical protein Vadar_022062 [Vaccinium darrowii]|uniref:Uncharacterized protein n=1 Tax=Vaccinium darrowii TaxID=229202 RepID=A0ACB7X2Q0_9ERIC|nr:hypothetical protein Vadar_022062 [Vaccinium darrowii]
MWKAEDHVLVESKENGETYIHDAVLAALQVLEDDPSTNVGRGSNLTEDGHMECDASIMHGNSGAFGAVGGVPGVRNASQIAALLAKEQMLGSSLLGRIPPIFLVGEGARVWAKSKGISLPESIAEADDWLVTERAKRQWEKLKAMLDDAKAMTRRIDVEPSGSLENATISEAQPCEFSKAIGDCGLSSTLKTPEDDCIMNTVGVICIDIEGHVAFGASSGGIVLKVVLIVATRNSGQMFHAVIRNGTQDPHRPIIGRSARSASAVIKFMQLGSGFAGTCSQAGPASACVQVLPSVIKDNSQHCTDKNAGVLIVQAEAPVNLPRIPPKLKAIEMAAAYSSLSFGIGPASACVKVLRSVIKDNSQHCTDKNAGVLIVQAEAPVNVSILRSARQQTRTDIDQFATRIDLSAEKMFRFGTPDETILAVVPTFHQRKYSSHVKGKPYFEEIREAPISTVFILTSGSLEIHINPLQVQLTTY